MFTSQKKPFSMTIMMWKPRDFQSLGHAMNLCHVCLHPFWFKVVMCYFTCQDMSYPQFHDDDIITSRVKHSELSDKETI